MHFLCSMNFPVTSFGQDAMCLSDSGKDGSEKPPPANLDLTSRKRFHCTLDESDHCLLYTSDAADDVSWV